MNIILGITGGIAAYKTPDLTRKLIKAGHEVQIVMTYSAHEFVSALSLQAVSGNPVRDDLFDEAAESAMGHIELARWAGLILIAPATAHCIAQLANGLASDLLTTLCLASTAPIMLAPAMNLQMWQHVATQKNIARLLDRDVQLIGPESGEQACGETGAGRMTEPEDIIKAISENKTLSC
ncbi:MAG: bifunctional phosphopantothenoylcysteine decarboxylase/phosphopantothenate--cysteine ligase CoaBC [Arenicellales bacterium]